jgi:hypothetical protein
MQQLALDFLVPEDEWAFDLLYCVAFVVMDKQWLDKNASYMDFNVRSACAHFILCFNSKCKSSTDLMFVMPLPGSAEVDKSPAGERAYAGRCHPYRRHAIIQPALLVTKIPNSLQNRTELMVQLYRTSLSLISRRKFLATK